MNFKINDEEHGFLELFGYSRRQYRIQIFEEVIDNFGRTEDDEILKK